MRAPIDTLSAPMIPHGLEWVNVASLRMDKQLGRTVLVEFWDFCRCNSLRTMPYVRAWHTRYAAAGLRVIAIPNRHYPPEPDALALANVVLGSPAELTVELVQTLDPAT